MLWEFAACPSSNIHKKAFAEEYTGILLANLNKIFNKIQGKNATV